MCRLLAFWLLLCALSAGAQYSWQVSFPPPSAEAGAKRPTQKTENFLRSGARQLRAGKHREAVQKSWDAFQHCDPVMAMNLRGVSEARWGKSRSADKSFSFGVEKAMEEGRSADTLLFNRALLNLETGDPATARQCLLQVGDPELFPDYFFNLALAESLSGQYLQALEHWDEAMDRDSSSAQVRYNRGWTNWQLSRYDDAIADLHRALDGRGPKGQVHLALSAVFSGKGLYREALAHARKAYPGHSRELPYLLAYGHLLSENGQFRAAQGVFRDAVALFPQSAAAHCGLGHALYHMRNFEGAALHFNKALRWNPEMPQALVGRGHVHSHYGRFWEALHDFDLALDYQPLNPFAWEGKGIAYFRLGRYNQAVDAFAKALEQDPTHRLSFDAYISQGFAAYRLGMLEEAKAAFEKAIARNPRHPSGYNGLACTYFGMEEFLLSVENFDLAVKYGPADDVILTNRGNARYRIMDYKGALRDFSAAVALNLQNEHAFNGMGICYHESEDYEKAVEMIEKAIGIDTTNKDLNINLGVSRGFLVKAYRNAGRFSLADTTYQLMLADHQRMLDTWADSSVYFINLGYLHSRLDQWDRSMELFQSVANPLALQYAENNMGILYALKDQYTRAQELFSQAISRDTQMEYAAPRVNRTLVNQASGHLSADDPFIIDQISTAQFQKILEKDKYCYTYFYYTLMRYAPPPPAVGFQNPSDIKIPALSAARGDYLLYPPSVECRKVKEVKPEAVRGKKEKRRGVGKGCPEV